jgi:hypothetical protein
MHMKLRILLLLSLAVLMSACGRPEGKKLSIQKIPITPEQMALIIANQTITCSDPSFCPEGIARMFSINFEDSNESTTCSAFLVEPDLVMTNTHCVHGRDMDLEKICSGLYFVFPGQGSTYSAQCSNIIWSNRRQTSRINYRSGDNDFALIRLDRNMPFTPFTIRFGGLKPDSKVFPVVVDQMGGYNARITKLECQAERLVEKFGVAKLSNCPVISGNSGSPVLDENQNVVGIIFASSNNTIRNANDALELRVKSNTKAFAFSMEYVMSKMGHLLRY